MPDRALRPCHRVKAFLVWPERETFIPLLGIIRMPCYTPHAYDKIKLMGGET